MLEYFKIYGVQLVKPVKIGVETDNVANEFDYLTEADIIRSGIFGSGDNGGWENAVIKVGTLVYVELNPAHEISILTSKNPGSLRTVAAKITPDYLLQKTSADKAPKPPSPK